MDELRASVMIGFPTLGKISHHLLDSAMSQTWPAMSRFSWQTIPGHTTEDARNRLVWMAQQNNSRYILFWDDDVIAPRFCIHHLYTIMEMNPQITVLSGIYGTKAYPPMPLVYRDWGQGSCYDWKVGELFQVKMGALGMSIIRVADLDKLNVTETYPAGINGDEIHLKRYFHTGKVAKDDGGILAWTEDVPFAEAIEKAGLLWYADASLHTICKHYDMASDTMFSLSVKNDVAVQPASNPIKEKYKVCNLGCGVKWYGGAKEAAPEVYTVRVDLNEDAHPDFRCDVRCLPSEWTGTFDEVKANHVLEHIRWEETDETLEEWIRILKPGGILKLGLPDLKQAAEKILRDEGKGRPMGPLLLGCIYGDQQSKFYNAHQDIGIHLTGFTPNDIAARLDRLGMEEIVVTSYNKGMMGVESRKPKKAKGKKDAP